MKRIRKGRSLYHSIKSLIDKARAHIVRKVNTTIIFTYYEIGRMIVENEQSGNSRAEYADQTLKQLSIDLTKEYGKGFSHRNLEYFRKFYLNYSRRISKTAFSKSSQNRCTAANANQISQTLSAFSKYFSLTWSHYILLMKIDNKDEQRFYD